VIKLLWKHAAPDVIYTVLAPTSGAVIMHDLWGQLKWWHAAWIGVAIVHITIAGVVVCVTRVRDALDAPQEGL
jgi:hypothetical protein